jgi:hypothetical protein
MSEESEPGFQKSPPTPPLGSRIRLGMMGAGVAGYSAVCGIGGGLFMTPILHYVRKLPLKNAVATSLALVSASATSATVAELIHEDGRLTADLLYLVLVLVLGSLVGAQVGFRVAKRLDVTFLKLVFALVLVLSGARLLFPGGEVLEVTGFVDVTFLHLGFAAVIGFASGFLAPLLGIGGGLVAVPALFLGVPGLGYLGARACGMAMGACASTRSLWLYAREGVVDKHRAVALAGGALIGASIGVQLVHLEGAVAMAKVLMGLTLWFVSARFLWDVVTVRREEPSDSGDQA